MSTTDTKLDQEEAWFQEGTETDEGKLSSFDRIRQTIVERKPYHYLPLSVSAEEQSTVVLAIYEERASKNITDAEADTLQKEYFETLDPSESAASVLTDIFAAKSKGWITATEAAFLLDNIYLSTADFELYEDLINSLSKEANTFILPRTPTEKPVTQKIREEKPQALDFLLRHLSKKTALAAATIVALGGAASIKYQQEGTLVDSMTSSFESSPQAPATPVIIQAETIEKVAKAKETIQQKKPIAIAPKIVVEKKASAEKETTISLPVITKINGAGEVSMDQAKSMIAWKKLGYNIGIKNTAEGKVFILKDSEGKKFTISQESLQKEQETIEAKLQ